MNTSACPLCSPLAETVLWRNDTFRVILVDDIAYAGYCRVVLNRHVREMTDLTPIERTHFMHAVFAVEQVLRDVMQPDKINLASLGNQAPHLHWHVIPRFTDDAHFPDPIWAIARRTSGPRRLDINILRTEIGKRMPLI